MTKYLPGNLIGPYNTLFVKRLPKSRGVFICSFCGKNFESKISHIVNGGTKSCGCQHFSFKYKAGDRIGPNNILLLERLTDKQYEYKGKFKCPECGAVFIASINSVVQGLTKSCGCLRNKNLKGHRFGKLTVLESTKQRQGTCIVWKCKCDCGNIHYVGTNHLTQGKTKSCGKCNLSSTGEEKILKILIDKKVKFETQKRFKDCRDKKPLPFDFYLPDYNCCIEYDGLGHYKIAESGWRTAENVKKTQDHDNIKTQYCKDNNINLIRISYKDYNNIEQILQIF